MELETWVERDEQEISVTVEFSYSSGCRGARDRYGAPLEPDDDAEIEIQSVKDEHGKEVELTTAEEKRIESLCWDDVADRV